LLVVDILFEKKQTNETT